MAPYVNVKRWHAYFCFMYMFMWLLLGGGLFIHWWTNLHAGSFFAKALFTRSEQDEEDEEQLSFKKNDLLMVRDSGPGDTWEGTMLSSGNHGLVPVNAMQPLPYPFYQWVSLCSLNRIVFTGSSNMMNMLLWKWVVVVKLYFLFGQVVPKEVPRQCWMLTHREGSIWTCNW